MKQLFFIFLILFSFGSLAKNNRIIGGSATSTGKYPYQVAIISDSGSNGFSQFCGGSILSANYVLTAAHCFREFSGSSNVDSSLSDKYAVSATTLTSISNSKKYKITQAFIHPAYSATVNSPDQVDLCVLRVNTISFDSTTLPVVLARLQDKSLFPAGTDSYVTGFGLTNGAKGSTESSNTLMEVTIPIVTMNACNQALSNSGLSVNFPVVCAGADGKDSCQGDSGGPLTIASQGTFVQVGVVVFGTVNSNNAVQCGAAGNYGVYTSVADYRASFIEPITGALPVLGDSGVALTNGTGGTTGASTTGGNSSSTLSLSPLLIFFTFLFVLINNFF